jgi:hypothetical protein
MAGDARHREARHRRPAFLTQAMVQDIIASGILPEGAIQLIVRQRKPGPRLKGRGFARPWSWARTW